jgi:hypothetical protein
VKLAEAPADAVKITLQEKPLATVRKLREGWLGS